MFGKNKKQPDSESAVEAWTDKQPAGKEPAAKERIRNWRLGRKPHDTEQTHTDAPHDANGTGIWPGKKQAGEDDRPTAEDADRLLYNLSRTQEGQQRYLPESPLTARLPLLRAWQSQRLARTYADMAEVPRYVLACRFFLEDIYAAPRDFSEQGEDMQRAYRLALKFLPGRIIRPVIQALDLYNLSEDLDYALLDVLVNRLGMTDSLTPQLYTQAYRLCDNYPLRVHQIELTGEVVRAMDGLARLPVVPATMRVARLPASRAGWSELHAFVERGVAALREMDGADPFLSAIQQREMEILDRIFAGDPDPFGIDWQS